MESGNPTCLTTMFKCRECGSSEFKLMLQPSFEGNVMVTSNDNDDVVIQVNGKEFIADLMFMNQFALCKGCDAYNSWEYFYPKGAISSQRKS